MTQADFQPVSVFEPAVAALPLVCDSPHSGETYPADFGAAASLAQLRQGEDTHVDALWSAAPALGATLVAANFPRVHRSQSHAARPGSRAVGRTLAGRWSPVKRRDWARG